jgi:hypothetical protein
VTDDPHTPNDELPARHNPIRALPWLDTLTEVEVFQLRPTLHNRLAEWCGGEAAVENGEIVVRIPGSPQVVARLGDFVVFADGVFYVEPADGFFLKYWPVGRDPGWTHRCFMDWEGS